MDVVPDKFFLRGVVSEIREFLLELFISCLLSHFELLLLEILLDLVFKQLMVIPNLVHKALKDLLGRAALLLWVHHVQ